MRLKKTLVIILLSVVGTAAIAYLTLMLLSEILVFSGTTANFSFAEFRSFKADTPEEAALLLYKDQIRERKDGAIVKTEIVDLKIYKDQYAMLSVYGVLTRGRVGIEMCLVKNWRGQWVAKVRNLRGHSFSSSLETDDYLKNRTDEINEALYHSDAYLKKQNSHTECKVVFE